MQTGRLDLESGDAIRLFVVGPLQTNCYAYVSGGACLVVDPGDEGDQIARALGDVEVKLVVATHGHGDHVGGVESLLGVHDAPFAIHAKDADRARHAGETSEAGLPVGANAPTADRLLGEGDVLEVGSARFEVLEVPGHTPGGICLVGRGSATGVCFVGDTLFPGRHGRTDLSGGDEGQILSSLRTMAERIAPDTVLLCGHGPATTMERELATNPFLSVR